MSKCIFLDRDGTINIEKDYLYKKEDFEWEENAKKAIKIFKELGYKVIVITNQSGIARGYYTEEDLHKLHDYIQEELKKEGTEIDAFYYCPNHEKGIGKYKEKSRDRKPDIGLFEKAKKEYGIDYQKSFMAGDKISDIEAAARLGMTPVFVKTGHGKEEIEQIYFKAYVYENIYEFALSLKNIYG